MRLLVLLLVPAFIGLVRSQNYNNGYNNGLNQVDQARFPGGSSGRRGTIPPQNAQNAPNLGPVQGRVNHANQGGPPIGGSSRQSIPDVAPVNPGPVVNRVNHPNAGNGPDPGQGGSSGRKEYPLGPVQTGQVDRVNMVNEGAAPIGGNQNSGEVYYGQGAQGRANNAPVNGNSNDQVHYSGGKSGGGGGPAYAAGTYSDNAGVGAPLGGAAINDLTQQEAGKAEHVMGAATVGSTVAGVVIAVLVLVGIVAVAAVFLVRQRQSRMTIASV